MDQEDVDLTGIVLIGHVAHQDKQGRKKLTRVRMLFDSGADKSVMDNDLATRLHLDRKPTPPLMAKLADGRLVRCGDTLQPTRVHLGW